MRRKCDAQAFALHWHALMLPRHGYETMHDGIGRSIDWNDNFFAFQHEDFDDIDWVPLLHSG